MGGNLSQAWSHLNYTPSAAAKQAVYNRVFPQPDPRFARIDAIRGSGVAGVAVVAGHAFGASDRTLDALAQGAGALEGVIGGAGGWKTLTLSPAMPYALARVRTGRLGVGNVDEYGRLLEQAGDGSIHRDHIPSKAALLSRAEALKGEPLSPTERTRIINSAEAVAVPAEVHRAGPTYGGRNSPAQIERDMADLAGARQRDADAMIENARSVVSPQQLDALEGARGRLTSRSNAEYDAWPTRHQDCTLRCSPRGLRCQLVGDSGVVVDHRSEEVMEGWIPIHFLACEP